jgi:hypothetical protein
VKKLLRLDVLTNSSSILLARNKIAQDPTVLNSESAVAMAKVTMLFGVGPQTERTMIADFIFQLLQGWDMAISKAANSTMQAMASFVSTTCRFSGLTKNWSIENKLEGAFADALEAYIKTKKSEISI